MLVVSCRYSILASVFALVAQEYLLFRAEISAAARYCQKISIVALLIPSSANSFFSHGIALGRLCLDAVDEQAMACHGFTAVD